MISRIIGLIFILTFLGGLFIFTGKIFGWEIACISWGLGIVGTSILVGGIFLIVK